MLFNDFLSIFLANWFMVYKCLESAVGNSGVCEKVGKTSRYSAGAMVAMLTSTLSAMFEFGGVIMLQLSPS